MAFIVRKRGAYAWDITDRRKASSEMTIKLEYSVPERKFSGQTKRRYSKVSPWQKWKDCTLADIEVGKLAIGDEELSRCIAASLLINSQTTQTVVDSPLGQFAYKATP